ncbi:MAG: biopolymer transporter ExbD [Planctomycetota bacterium]
MPAQYESEEPAEVDMTPMIDMTFQLIAFFMVLINFTQTESIKDVTLPSSRLIKPPEIAVEDQIILHVLADGTVNLGGQEYAIGTLGIPLDQEKAILRAQDKGPDDAQLVIRADQDTQTGKVQDVIKAAQDQGFSNFHLRAKQNKKSGG